MCLEMTKISFLKLTNQFSSSMTLTQIDQWKRHNQLANFSVYFES
jgi:hypothetical protein